MWTEWTNAAGLACDFAGFCLLGYEWWRGFTDHLDNVELEAVKAEHQARQRTGLCPPTNPLSAGSEVGQLRAVAAGYRYKARCDLVMRGTPVAVAFVLIVIGFVLQLIGQWPTG